VADSHSSTWHALVELALRTGPATGAGVAVGLGVEPTWELGIAAVGATVIVNIVVPVTRAIGRGLEHRIDRRMGTPSELPPRPPPQTSEPPEQSIES